MESVSNYNLELHQRVQYPCTHANKDVLTIAINGLPADKREFEGFTFTKRFVNYFAPGFEINQTEEFYIKRVKEASMETVIKEIDAIVVANGNKVVFVSHSNGCFFTTAYIHRHPTKVIGIIEFGCIPISFYMSVKIFGEHFIFNQKDKDPDAVYEEYLQWLRDFTPGDLMPMNKHTLKAFFSILNTEVFKEMFEWRRNYPKILKLITYGRQDVVIERYLLNGMAYYFTYGNGSIP